MSVGNESCELLRAIARQTSDAQLVHRLAMRVQDWDALIDTAREHRMLPMLFLQLDDMGSAVPPLVQEQMRSEYNRNVFHNLTNAVELIAVIKAFDDQTIPAMPFKGVVLGASCYGDFMKRAAGDIDVLIYKADRERTKAILLERGYELTEENIFEDHFERASDGLVMELRWQLELVYGRYKRELGMDWVWPHRRTTKLAGADVPDMSPENTLLVLCMHGSKHVWSRLNWICDVAQFLRATPDLDWKAVIREARAQGLGRVLALGVLLAHRVTDAEVPQPILRRFESDRSIRSLAQHIDENLFLAAGSTPEDNVPYWVRVLDFRDRMRSLFSLGSLRPNERDRAAFPLPKALYPLYFVIRPFRLLRDRSAR